MKEKMTSKHILKMLEEQGDIILAAINQIASGENQLALNVSDDIDVMSNIAEGLSLLAEDVNNRFVSQQEQLEILEEELKEKSLELEQAAEKLENFQAKKISVQPFKVETDANALDQGRNSTVNRLFNAGLSNGSGTGGSGTGALSKSPSILPVSADGTSTLTVPINYSNQFIGMLGFEGDDLNNLSSEDLLAVEDIAEQVGVALENQRLFDQTQVALLESQALYQISSDLNAAETTEDILQAFILTMTGMVDDIATARLWMVNTKENGEFQLQLTDLWDRAGGQATGPRDQFFELSNFPEFEKVLLNTKEPLYINSINENTFANNPVQQKLMATGLRNIIMLPLLIGNRPIGVFTIGWRVSREFSSYEVQRYSIISAQMANSLDGLQLLEETKLRARQTQIALAETHTLYRISSLLNSAESSQDIVSAIVDTMSQDKFDVARLWLAQETSSGEIWIEITESWLSDDEFDPFLKGARFQLGNYPFLDHLLRESRETALISDLAEDPQTSEDENLISTLAEPDQTSMAFLPLTIGSRLIGLFSLGWKNSQAFSANDAQRYAAIGAQLATSVDSLRLLEETQLRAEQLEKLAGLEASLSAARDENEIAMAVAREFPNARTAVHFINSDELGNPTSFETVASFEHGEFLSPSYLRQEYEINTFPCSEIWLDFPNSITSIPNIFEHEGVSNSTKEFAKQMGYPGTVILPLHRGQAWEGVITISWKEPHQLNKTEAFLLEQLREPLSAIVTSRRAQIAEQLARQESEVLYNASSALNQADSDLESFNQTIKGFSEQFGIDHTVLLLYEKDQFGNPTGLKVSTQTFSPKDYSEDMVSLNHIFSRAAFEQISEFEEVYFIENIKNKLGLTTGTKRMLEQCGFTTSGIIMPLSVSQVDIGILLFIRSEPIEFSRGVSRLATSLTPQISVAVQNRLLLSETQSRAEQLERLANIEAELSAASDINQITQTIGKEFPNSCTAVHFISSDEELNPITFETKSSYEDGKFGIPGYVHDRPFPIERMPTAEVWIENPGKIVPNVLEHENITSYSIDFIENGGYQATTIVPLHRGRAWEGVITISWKEQHTLDETETFLLEQLREPLSAIVTSRRAQAAEELARQESEVLYNASSALNQADSDLESFNQTIKGFSEQFGIDHTVLLLYEKDQFGNPTGLKVSAQTFSPEDYSEKMVSLNHIFGRAAFEQISEFKEIYFIENIKDKLGLTTGTKRMLEQCGFTTSGIIMPLSVSQVDIGFMLFIRSRPSRFSEGVSRLAISLTPQISVAVQNRLLLNQTQKRADREQKLRQLTEKVRNNTDVEAVMQTAVTEIGRLLGRKTFLYLKDNNDATGQKN
ncbi:MAG: hypothetical protein AAF902_01555 [Chloroflexota bacterium]